MSERYVSEAAKHRRELKAKNAEEWRRILADESHPYHGTVKGYRHGCRCDRCGAAMREYNRAIRKNKALRDWGETPQKKRLDALMESAAKPLPKIDASGADTLLG